MRTITIEGRTYRARSAHFDFDSNMIRIDDADRGLVQSELTSIDALEGITEQANNLDVIAELEAAQMLHQATVSLTNNQIKALPTTAIELVAAPGANKIVVPTMAMAVSDITTAYTNIHADGYVAIKQAGGTDLLYLGVNVDGSLTLLTQLFTTDRIAYMSAPAQVQEVGYGIIAGLNGDLAEHVNVALQLYAENMAAGAFTGGHANNTLRVSVAYFILNLSTGEYEAP